MAELSRERWPADRLMASFTYTYSSACDNTGIAREENQPVEPLGLSSNGLLV
jgi:hypothetical protein